MEDGVNEPGSWSETTLDVDPSVPSAARVYDYILGGKHNFAVDRAAAETARARVLELDDIAWSNRGFHQRAARWLADQGKLRQFIDIGSGLPTQKNTHEAMQDVVSDARVVYSDNDPIVAVHAQELLRDSHTTAFVSGDVRDPEALFAHPEVRELIDFGEPVGVLMTALMHLISDAADPAGLVARWMGALAPGSYLALSHMTNDRQATGHENRMRGILAGGGPLYLRTRSEVERLFAGLEIVPPYPGADLEVTFAGLWGAEDAEAADSDGSRWLYCAVARKP